MAVERHQNTKTYPHLPPREYWLYDPEKDGLLPTPVDERGLVDVKKTIATVLSVIDAEYPWDSDSRSNIHHSYYPASDYRDLLSARVNPRKFRELAINQTIVPVTIHPAIHTFMAAPEMPEEEVMEAQIQKEEIVRTLAGLAKRSTKLDKKYRTKRIGEEKFQRGCEYNVLQFLIELEETKESALAELGLINSPELDLNTAEELNELASFLGKLANKANYTRDIKNRTFLGKYALSPFTGTSATLVT